MNCDDFRKHVHAYYQDRLSEAQRRDLERHAAGCTACGELYAVAQQLSCRELVEFLDDYVEGQLAAERLVVFERHLSLCADCVNFLRGYRAAQAAARAALGDAAAALDVVPMPDDLVRAILAARRA
jgi:anti-sigma factor RsiW